MSTNNYIYSDLGYYKTKTYFLADANSFFLEVGVGRFKFGFGRIKSNSGGLWIVKKNRIGFGRIDKNRRIPAWTRNRPNQTENLEFFIY